MRLLTFLRFMRQILKKGPADLDWIQRQGLLSVKLAQIFALRSDILSVEKCQQLQSLYQIDYHTIQNCNIYKLI